MTDDLTLETLAADWDRSTAPPVLSHQPASVRYGKRFVDVMGALVGLALTAPVLPLIALAIRLDSPGPILFRQLRVGESTAQKTKLFYMIKFRSMGVNAEAKTGPVWATKNDPRVTRVGRFMRKTRLDEIPQLLNVLKGDMSLIGPRPERPGIVPRLENSIPFFSERVYGVRPGITGLAQVYQGYDETVEDTRCKVGYDHAYALSLTKARHWLAMDAMIVLRTVLVVVTGRGH
ncbi:sugar transferase [Elstera litoralis]|uniref:Sugar transferase n=1 Tax=Elstera litoralis TaxID=552518 RepID=A0A0F3IQQ5_9PROT|nr:sugar transferase [Elstera litoralis]KJV08888.1 sugar transferase [Elstera litoralis]